jgi:integrase
MLDSTHSTGTTADVISVLRLTPLNASTRVITINSVRTLREVLSGGPDIPADAFFAAAEAATPELRAQIGDRHSQILSDVKRAKRAWADPFRRDLVLRLQGRLPTLQDAIDAVDAGGCSEQAKRTVQSLRKLAESQATSPADIIATAIVVEPLLRRLTPEDLDVHTSKSLSNKLAQIRAAVRLVDPNAISGRAADMKALPKAWRDMLEKLEPNVPASCSAEIAILRRLAVRANQDGLAPGEVQAGFLKNFIEHELATKSDSHKDKLRRAGRVWNEIIASEGLSAAHFENTGPQNRLPDVPWEAVPERIRTPVDALMDRMVAPQGDEDWSSFIEDCDDDDLGLGDLVDDAGHIGAAIPRELGTQGNLRAAVKRVWHAAETSSKVPRKPERLEDLFRQDCLVATVAAIREKRRLRVEARGESWEAHKKGRYECSLVQALYSVGKSCDLPEEVLEPVRKLTLNLDPSVVGTKLKSDGTLAYVYEDRKIGKHHEDMLRQFNEDAALKRWFQAPGVLWREAEKWVKQGRDRPTFGHAALARSALIAQLAQRVTPMRRSNLARLRAFGDESHLSLPIGAGEGTLILPGAELKNLRSIHVTIDPETVRMLKRFIAIYRPLFAELAGADPENPHLFPGTGSKRKERGINGGYEKGFGYITNEKLSQRFRQHIWKHCQLRMDLQVMRHIAGKVILDMDPSAMGLVQEVLGHKRIETTQSYYAQVSKIVAQKNYLQLLDQYSRRVMSHVDFRIDLEQQLEG